MTDTMRGLLERDGQSVDYSSLSIRHMGNILETINGICDKTGR